MLPNPGGVIEPNNQETAKVCFSWPMETDRTLPAEKEKSCQTKRKIKEYKLPYATQLAYDIVVTINPFIWSQGVQWYVEAPRQAYVNSPFWGKFCLENGQGKDLKFPAFQGLDVLAKGPSVSNQYADINGVVSRTITYGFQLRATQEGKITLEEASVVVKGKLYKTKAVSIDITKPDKAMAGSTDTPALVRLKLSDHKIYKGQQLTAAYELYYRGSIGLKMPFSIHPFMISVPNRWMLTMNIPEYLRGKQYEGVLADAIALFPKNGKLKIDPSYFSSWWRKGLPTMIPGQIPLVNTDPSSWLQSWRSRSDASTPAHLQPSMVL